MSLQDAPHANLWCFQLTSLYNQRIAIEEKHWRFMAAFELYGRPWGVKDLAVPKAPEYKSAELCAHLTLTRLLKTPVRYAAITYALRGVPAHHEHEDFIHFEFNKTKISSAQYKHLIHDVLPDYIQAFDGDQLKLYPLQPYLNYVFETGRRECFGSTTIRGRVIPYIAPVNFWSNSKCIQGFGRTAQQIASLLDQEDVAVSWIGDGIYVVFSEEMISDEQALDFEHQFRQLLQHKSVC